MAESDADTASMSTGTVSHRPTPGVTPAHSFSGADRTRPIDIAEMLDPFEALEREFGWEGGVTIRPPSAVSCSSMTVLSIMSRFGLNRPDCLNILVS